MKICNNTLPKVIQSMLIACIGLLGQISYLQAQTLGDGNINTVMTQRNSSQTPALEYNFNATDWYYIAFTKAINGSGSMFVNGEFVGDITWDDVSYDHTILNIAASYFVSYTGYFSGTIDEIRVTNTLKDVTELKAHFDANQSFAQEASTAYIWKFDEGTGDQFSNEAGDRTGTLYGGPVWVDGKFGKAVSYDGIDDRGRLNVGLLEYQVTYEFWVKFDGDVSASSQTILQPYGGNGSSIDFQITQTLIDPPPVVREDVVFTIGARPDVAKGAEVLVPVTVDKFIDILTVQQTISWDPTVLQYQRVQDFTLTDLNASSFNSSNPGKLVLSWLPNDVLPKTVDDGETIFNLVFSAVGDAGTMSDVIFGDDPTPREVSDEDANILDVVYNDGSVSIVDEVTVSGVVKTQSGEVVPGVEVLLSGGSDQTTVTDDLGAYSFTVVPNLDYQITPSFEVTSGADDGVSTIDLVIMQWHILGMKYMMSNYDLIASDVNQSGSLTTMDVAQTRAVILHVDESFGGRSAIEFINHEYTGVPDIFSYQSFLAITPAVSQNDLDFTVVKLGDAGRNWSAASAGGREQNLDNFEIIMERSVLAGNKLLWPLKAVDFSNMIGLQFTLEWDPEVYQFERLVDQELHFDANLNMVNDGKLTVVWNSERLAGVSLDDQAILSGIEFTQLSDADPQINITSGVTPALAFNADLEALRISGTELRKNLSAPVMHVYPNPSQDVINVELSDAMPTRYAVTSTTGRIVKSGELSGENQVDITELKKGLYIIQVYTDDQGDFLQKFIKQ